MAALVDVDAAIRGTTPPADPAALSSYLFDREHDYWQSLYVNDRRIATSPETIARAVYTASLTSAQPREQAELIIGHIGIAEGAAAVRVLQDHSVCYPADKDGMFLSPLYPDRLAEDFIALYTPEHGLAGYASDKWANGALFRLLIGSRQTFYLDPTGSNSITPSGEQYDKTALYLRSAMLRFISAAQRWPHLVYKHLDTLLDGWPTLALMGGNAALIALAETPGINNEVLDRIQDSLPFNLQSDLAVGAAAIARRVAAYLIPISDENRRADIHIRLGERLRHAGFYDEALEETRKGIAILENLIGNEDFRYRSRLAAALGFLAQGLFTLALYDDALAAIDRALDLWECLEPVDLDAYYQHAATALSQRAKILTFLGRGGEAEEAVARAMHLHEQRAGGRAVDHSHAQTSGDQAVVLIDTAILYNRRGRLAEAIELVRQGIDIFRELAHTNGRELYEPDLAVALNNLSNYLSRDNKHNEALTTVLEAIAILRKLANDNPRVFSVQLAEALYNGARRHLQVGRSDDAMAMTAEAISKLRGCSNEDWAVYGDRFVRLLTAGSELAFALGQYQMALEWSREAVEALERPGIRGPAVQAEHIAEAMIMFAVIRARLGSELEVATSIAEQATRKLSELSASNPGQFGESLQLAEEILRGLKSDT